MKGTDSIREIKGVGAKTQEAFLRLGISTINDFLGYFPKRYEQFNKATFFSDMVLGEKAAVKVKIISNVIVKSTKNMKICTCKVSDGKETRDIVWFRALYLSKVFRIGQEYIFYGIAVKKNQQLTFEHPKYYSLTEYHALMKHLQPIYAIKKGLTQNLIRKTIKQILPYFHSIPEYLSEEDRQKYHLIPLSDAFVTMHFPLNKEQIIPARRRIVFHEFLTFYYHMEQLKLQVSEQNNEWILNDTSLQEQIQKKLPYQLTNAQEKVLSEINNDVCSHTVMNRLLQGDVGSGKTIVALLALLLAVQKGHQGAIMAPTEVLAKQHYLEFSKILSSYDIHVELLTSTIKGKQRKKILSELEHGEIDILVGTHALVQEKVVFADLAMIVTDEQHRFGVKQREALVQKGKHPHVLIMSATPIPRTLAMMLYGNMDISIMNELPKNRKPIKNCVVTTDYRNTAYKFMYQQLKEGHQIYIICPMIEENEDSDLENVLTYTSNLKNIFPESIEIAYLHGKMKPEEKEQIMSLFAENQIQILVSTTVIEVGINVPNATVMMIENAERFGLAQLHQLRGRVGRGNDQSYCIFMCQDTKKETKERLNVLEKSNDGFFIANEDLKQRGPGDFFGIRQSGDFDFKLADIYQDASVAKEAKNFYEKHANDNDLWQQINAFQILDYDKYGDVI